jgi:cell shape-determining protein MreC
MVKDKVERENVLISVSPEFAQLLRDMAQILYPENKYGSLSRTAEEAFQHLAKQAKYQSLLKKIQEVRTEAERLKEDLKGEL